MPDCAALVKLLKRSAVISFSKYQKYVFANVLCVNESQVDEILILYLLNIMSVHSC